MFKCLLSFRFLQIELWKSELQPTYQGPSSAHGFTEGSLLGGSFENLPRHSDFWLPDLLALLVLNGVMVSLIVDLIAWGVLCTKEQELIRSVSTCLWSSALECFILKALTLRLTDWPKKDLRSMRLWNSGMRHANPREVLAGTSLLSLTHPVVERKAGFVLRGCTILDANACTTSLLSHPARLRMTFDFMNFGTSQLLPSPFFSRNLMLPISEFYELKLIIAEQISNTKSKSILIASGHWWCLLRWHWWYVHPATCQSSCRREP